MSYETIRFEKKEGIATITLNRPERLNAFTWKMGEELTQAMKLADADEEVRAMVLTGAGRAFCAGFDVQAFAQEAAARKEKGVKPSLNLSPGEGAPWVMANLSKPIIAAINGPAVGVGLTMTLPCDIRIASENALLGSAFIRVGLIPEFGSTYFLTRLVGIAKACELVFTGKNIDAREAKEMGLVNQVVAPDKLMEATYEMARSIAEGPPIAIRLSKRALYQGLNADLVTQIQYETFALNWCFQSEDHAEGIRAFAEKRKPQFKGR